MFGTRQARTASQSRRNRQASIQLNRIGQSVRSVAGRVAALHIIGAFAVHRHSRGRMRLAEGGDASE